MSKSRIFTALLCAGLIPASIFFVIIILLALGFNAYTITEGSYRLPENVSVGSGFVFTPTYRETVLTAPIWLKSPGIGDEIIYKSPIKISDLASTIYCIGRIREIVDEIYLIEDPRVINVIISISVGNMSSLNLCSFRVNMSSIEGVVVLKTEEQHSLPLLIAFIAATSSAFSVLLSYIILKYRRL